MSADLKRAEAFKRDKDSTVGNATSAESPDAHGEGLFFDAEKDRDGWKS
jgi:hypothetical protein